MRAPPACGAAFRIQEVSEMSPPCGTSPNWRKANANRGLRESIGAQCGRQPNRSIATNDGECDGATLPLL